MTVLRVAGVIFNMRQREMEAALKVCGSDPFLPPFAPRAPCRGLCTRHVPLAGGSARRAGYFARTGPDGSSRWAVPLSQRRC